MTEGHRGCPSLGEARKIRNSATARVHEARPIKDSRERHSPHRQRPAAGDRGAPPAARTRRPGRRASLARAGIDPHPRSRFCRPLLPVLAHRELEPRGGHRQVGGVRHRPRRRHPRRARRKAGLRLLGRYQPARTRRGGHGGAGDRPPGPIGALADRPRRRFARALRPARSRPLPIRGFEGGVARASRADGESARSACHAGDGIARR